jgi:transcriptional regulator with XRE-family HTH domain
VSFTYDKLRGKIKEKYGTQDEFARNLGISRSSLSLKLNNVSEFSQKEMLRTMELLGESPSLIDEYFFTLKVKKSEH